MSDATIEYKRHLLDRITNALENGGCLSDTIFDYIDATLFSPEPDRLAAFLNDDTGSERDSLLDLIFYPDQAIQIDLEPLLEAARYSVDDEKELYGRLITRGIDAPVKMPDGRKLVIIQVPDFIKTQYLGRLNISWQMDPHVAAAIESGVSAALGPIVKVRLRNAGVRFTSNQRVFLCRFFERMADNDPDYLACLNLVLSILESAGEGGDVFDLLVQHKRSFFRGLQQAKHFERLLGRSNMETLMLQGVRAPHVSRNELMHKMRLIDLICFGIFGKTEAIDLPMEEPVREVSNLENLEVAIQSLLG